MSTTDQTVESYNKFAQIYTDHITNDKNFWNRYLEHPAMEKILKPIVKYRQVLDLGCGSGVSTEKLFNLGANIQGIDISEEMVNLAKERLPNVTFLVGNIEKTPYPNDEFDIVSSSLVMHYIKDLIKVFSEVHRILKNNGRFVFSMHHPFAETKKKVVIDGKKEYVYLPYFHNDKYRWAMAGGEMILDSFHHTFENITNSLIDSGFRINRVIETTPIKEGESIDAEDYDKTNKFPSFIVYDGTKIN